MPFEARHLVLAVAAAKTAIHVFFAATCELGASQKG
jgi:hypothetical protein